MFRENVPDKNRSNESRDTGCFGDESNSVQDHFFITNRGFSSIINYVLHDR